MEASYVGTSSIGGEDRGGSQVIPGTKNTAVLNRLQSYSLKLFKRERETVKPINPP